MKMMRIVICAVVLALWLGIVAGPSAYAETIQLENGQIFDSDFYAEAYPDVKAAFGNDFSLLLAHYLNYGLKEGRFPSAQAALQSGSTQTVAVNAISEKTAEQELPALVPINKLQNRNSLKKKCTDAEFQEAYNAAAGIVTPLMGLSKEEQIYKIAQPIRSLVDSGYVVYSTSYPHYNDPYGYFILGVGSCAGDTRATGLCLNMLGINYEHVNENQWSHQWCRVMMDDGTYWIVDPYGLYVGAEPAPYAHPYLY